MSVGWVLSMAGRRRFMRLCSECEEVDGQSSRQHGQGELSVSSSGTLETKRAAGLIGAKLERSPHAPFCRTCIFPADKKMRIQAIRSIYSSVEKTVRVPGNEALAHASQYDTSDTNITSNSLELRDNGLAYNIAHVFHHARGTTAI